MSHTVRTPQQDRSRDKLERIYAVAVALLVEGGWDAVTVGEIERRSKVSRSTFYLRFPTRESLIDYTRARLLDEVAADEAAAFERARASGPSTLEDAVRAAVEALAHICRTHGPAMTRIDSPEKPGVSDEAMNTLSVQFRSVIEPLLPTAIGRERMEFGFELAFHVVVGKVRPQQPFTAHTRLPWEGFLGELSRAVTRYLTD